MTTRKQVAIDFEHNCERFWGAVFERLEAGDKPPCLGELVAPDGRTSHVLCTEAQWRAFEKWCQDVPGYHEDPFVVNEFTP